MQQAHSRTKLLENLGGCMKKKGIEIGKKWLGGRVFEQGTSCDPYLKNSYLLNWRSVIMLACRGQGGVVAE